MPRSPRRWSRAASILIAPLVLVLPLAARAARPRAVVTVVEAGDPSTADIKSLRALLEDQLEQHDIKVVRKPPPPLAGNPRRLRAFAKKKHLDRVYDLRLSPQGRRLEVVLTERKAPSLRSTFSARLSAAGPDKVQKVIPRLVGAVVARAEPEPEEEAAAAPAPAPQIQTAPEPRAADPAGPEEERRRGEFLIGVSADLGTFLHSAAGLYGGTAKLFYQWTSLRVGAELGGSGGSGSSFHITARADYVFLASGFSPYLGAGLGYLMIKDGANSEGGGGYFSADVGVEYSRWRKLHLFAQADVLLPFFSAQRDDIVSHNGIIDFRVASVYSPAILFKIGCLY